MDSKTHRRVRLTRAIILNREHTEEGTVHELPRALAQRLIGEGSAEEHLNEGESPEPAPTTVRIDAPTNADPVPQNADPKPAKRKSA